jgi:sarcosine oxidase
VECLTASPKTGGSIDGDGSNSADLICLEFRSYKYIVVGCGGLGSAAVYWLSKSVGGKNVLGIEQHSLGHGNGGSDDHSRIIRKAYSEDHYTRIANHMYEAWDQVESDSGVKLVHKTGIIVFGPGDGEWISQYQHSLKSSGNDFEIWDSKEAMRRYPQLRLQENDKVLFEPSGGIVEARKANMVHLQLATRLGATILENTPVKGIKRVGELVEVETSNQIFVAEKLILCAGAWTNKLLSHVQVELPLNVLQEQVSTKTLLSR